MRFAGFIKNSFVDYPENIAAVVFTFGCNFNCWYCHNHQLIEGDAKETISEDEVLKFLQSRQGMLDSLVISGGEPTLHADIKPFIEKVKALGYKVKLDTNGTNPKFLQQLLSEKLIDFVAMDIKTDLKKYKEIIERDFDIEDIKKSINIIMNSGIDYEFRTTFSPDITVQDIEEIAKTIAGAKSYAIQKYNPVDDKIIKIPHSKNTFLEAKNIAQKYVKNCFLRSID